ncbi:hypothetical protein C8J56DRAFT_548605 [Mycena floridula]|nr:hypothetical protein C8J56DRAFT_548605 [Mycena floridula]
MCHAIFGSLRILVALASLASCSFTDDNNVHRTNMSRVVSGIIVVVLALVLCVVVCFILARRRRIAAMVGRQQPVLWNSPYPPGPPFQSPENPPQYPIPYATPGSFDQQLPPYAKIQQPQWQPYNQAAGTSSPAYYAPPPGAPPPAHTVQH